MVKANFKLPDGTSVTIDGATEEVERVLSLYRGDRPVSARQPPITRRQAGAGQADVSSDAPAAQDLNLGEIVNLVKTCEEAELIERRILDGTSAMARTLLPLYIVHEHLDGQYGLTSGDISKVTTDLGARVRVSNASTTLASGAARYVIGDKVRKKGLPVRYRLSRRGVQFMKSIISPNTEAHRQPPTK